MTTPDHDVPRSRLPEALALGLVAVAFTLTVGPIGTAATVAVALVWYAWGVPYAIAVGFIVAGAVFPGFDPEALLVAASLASLVPAEALSRREGSRALVAAVLAPLTLSAAAWLLVAWAPLWLAATVILCPIALAGYALHRLALFDLGVLDPTDSDA